MHGDTLCTDDVDYQKFRAYARDPQNQARFLAQPLAARRAADARLARAEREREAGQERRDHGREPRGGGAGAAAVTAIRA